MSLAPFPCLPGTAGKALAHSPFLSPSLLPSETIAHGSGGAGASYGTQTARRALANESTALPRPANRRRGRWRAGAGSGGHREVWRPGVVGLCSSLVRPVWKRCNLKEESGGQGLDLSGHRLGIGGQVRGAETGTSTSSAPKVHVLGVFACEGRIRISQFH